MTYEILLVVPDADPIVETGTTLDPITLIKQRLARFLFEHGAEAWTSLTVTYTREPET